MARGPGRVHLDPVNRQTSADPSICEALGVTTTRYTTGDIKIKDKERQTDRQTDISTYYRTVLF